MVRFSKIELVDGQVVESDVREISQVNIAACPHVIMVADHYREDGTCKCNDPEEQKMMIDEWGYSIEDFDNLGRGI